MRLNPTEGVVLVNETKFVVPGEWHNAATCLPYLPGVYEVNPIIVSADESVRRFAYCDGRDWRPAASTIEHAERNKMLQHYKQTSPIVTFRGLDRKV